MLSRRHGAENQPKTYQYCRIRQPAVHFELREQDDADLSFLADYIYRKGFLNYYKKQWGVTPEELDPAVAERVPVSVSTNDDYFVDRYQAIPQDGYTKMIENILAHPLIEVRLNTPYDAENFEAENVYYTGPIDEFLTMSWENFLTGVWSLTSERRIRLIFRTALW